jgi:hypothetical protein
MSDRRNQFLRNLAETDFQHVDRAVGLLWWYSRDGTEAAEVEAGTIAADLEAAGYAKQNATRLRKQLQRDSRVALGNRGFRLNVTAATAAEKQFSRFAGPRRPTPSESVLPIDLFFDTRGYLEDIVFQLNASYDYTLFDCCAVMCRRLVEILIIEVYEANGRQSDIQDGNGNYLMFLGLRTKIDSDSAFHLSRNARSGLQSAKRLGDLSAHNPRYTARKNDIDRERDDLRVLCEELLRHAQLV